MAKKGSGAGLGRENSANVRIRHDLLEVCHELVNRDLSRQRLALPSPLSDSQAVQHAMFWVFLRLRERLHDSEEQADVWREWDSLVEANDIAPGVIPPGLGPEYDRELERRFGLKIRTPKWEDEDVPLPKSDGQSIF